VNLGSYENLRQFTNWWWRNDEPLALPDDCLRLGPCSSQFVMFRDGQFQVEQVALYAGAVVPEHWHPNVDTYECHVTGGGEAYVGDVRIPDLPDFTKEVKFRRLHIAPGVHHRGRAAVDNVALSFQHWLNGVTPTFITDDWVQEGGGTWS